jgi:DNA polymerase-3 subunit beta
MIVLKAVQEKVLSALQAVAGIVERRHTLPILANVLIRKTGEQIELTTSDLEIQVRTRAELGGDEGNFATTVGARKLIDILRSMPVDQVVSLSANQNKLTLQGGKSRFTLQTMPSDDFPLVQEAADFGPAFSVPQKALKGLINQVHFAMAVHDIRYPLLPERHLVRGRRQEPDARGDRRASLGPRASHSRRGDSQAGGHLAAQDGA